MIGLRPGMTWMAFKQLERAIGMLTAGMLASDVAQHFHRHESTISRLLNRFQQTGTDLHHAAGRPFSHDFSSTQFLSSRKLGRWLRNATGTRVCDRNDRTVSNRLHAARLTAYRDGIIEPVVVPYLQQHNVWIFQHDNASPHTARHTQNILRIHNVKVLQWSARSPDLGAIEHLWDHSFTSRIWNSESGFL